MGITAALTAASAAFQVVGGIRARRQAEREAQQTRIETAEKVVEKERETRRLRSRQLVGFLKSGVTLEGTPLEILEETETLGAQDVAAIRRGGTARARTLREEGRSRLIGGIAGAAGTFARIPTTTGDFL